jgi:hypothetical protein
MDNKTLAKKLSMTQEKVGQWVTQESNKMRREKIKQDLKLSGQE